jgi:hypothetical protein
MSKISPLAMLLLGKSALHERLSWSNLSYHELWSGMDVPRLTERKIRTWVLEVAGGRLLPSQAPRYHNLWDCVWGFRLASPDLAKVLLHPQE